MLNTKEELISFCEEEISTIKAFREKVGEEDARGFAALTETLRGGVMLSGELQGFLCFRTQVEMATDSGTFKEGEIYENN